MAVGDLHRRALGVGDVAEQPAVEAVKRLRRGEKTVAAGIPNHDAGGLRGHFDDVESLTLLISFRGPGK